MHTVVADHMESEVFPKLEMHNENFAVRVADLITLQPRLGRFALSLSERRGTGRYRNWTPNAVQRASFGRGWTAAIRKRCTRKQTLGALRPSSNQRRNVQASSSKAVADFYHGGATHISQLWQALALRYSSLATKYLKDLPNADVAVVIIEFDETEQPCTLENESGIYEMLMIHVQVLWFEHGKRRCRRIQVPVAPAFIANKEAKTILNVILSRLPIKISSLLKKVRLLFIVPTSDSARPCKRVGRTFRRQAKLRKVEHEGAVLRTGVLSVHGTCMMHMLAVCIGALLKDLGLLNPIFCGSCLLQKGGTRKKIKAHCHRQTADMQFDYSRDEPPGFDAKVKYLEAVLIHMDYTDSGTWDLLRIDGEPAPLEEVAPTERQQARKRVAFLLGASTIEQGVIVARVHWCTIGCHRCKEAAIDDVNTNLDKAILDMGVGIPAINKWIKLYKPSGYWSAGVKLGVLPDAFESICGEVVRNAPEDVMRESELWGIGDAETFAKKRVKRFNKTNKFLHGESTSLALAVGTTVLMPAATEMSTFFQEAVWGKNGRGMADFISMDRNPAMNVCTRYLQALSNMESDFWIVVRGVDGWTQDKLCYASTETLKMIGGQFLRMIVPFMEEFPWPLLGLKRASNQRKFDVASALFHCAEHHLEHGVAAPVRSAYASVEELIQDADFINDLDRCAQACPNNNVACEDRFGRQNCYNRSSRGNFPRHEIIAARHVLPEAQAWHRIAMDELHNLFAQPVRRRRDPRQRKYRNNTAAFVGIHSKEFGGNLRRIMIAWRSLTPVEQADYLQYTRQAGQNSSGSESDEPVADGSTFDSLAATHSPFGAGSSAYALSSAHVEQACADLPRAVLDWRAVVGKLFTGAESNDDGNVMHQCSERYGFGRCETDFDADERADILLLEKTVMALSRRPSGTVGKLKKMVLVNFAGPLFAAGHDEAPPPNETVDGKYDCWGRDKRRVIAPINNNKHQQQITQ